MAGEDDLSIWSFGDDSPPLVSRVPDQPVYWGKFTSQARTASAEYLRFLQGGDQCPSQSKKKSSERDSRSSTN